MLHSQIQSVLQEIGVTQTLELARPPSADMGDIAIPCFALAKDAGKNPAEAAKDLAQKITQAQAALVERAAAAGPYVNLTLNAHEVARLVLQETKKKEFGTHELGAGKKYLVEYGCPNPMKAFHLGHLRNLITGESVARVLENAGCSVLRVNYQGDVGMHIAKTLWGMQELRAEYEAVVSAPLVEQVAFLGKAYAHGAQAFEADASAKEAVLAINKQVYAKDEAVRELYEMGREWSLEYFHTIYTRLGTTFDELYFESEVWERGLELVQEYLKRGIFEESQGAVIFPGSKHGLHDRVFITGEGNPTYEAKDLALSERRFEKHNPDSVIHVVGKEQTEYFQVVFKAMELINPQTKGKEIHVPGGFLQLKEGKMSSRTGRVITGDALLERVGERVGAVMREAEIAQKEDVRERVTIAAVKYAILKTHVSADVAFDMEASVSLSGDSGPYLLYTVARIRGILEKAGEVSASDDMPTDIHAAEKQLLLLLDAFPDATHKAQNTMDPSHVAQYLFTLAQAFSTFYHECPVAQAEDAAQKAFRVQLVRAVRQVMERGLSLLGIEPVEKM